MLGIRVDLSEVWGTSSTAARRKHQGRIFRRTDYNSGGMCTGKKWARFLDSYVAATNEKEVVLTAKRAGLIQGLVITRVPVLIGDGVPLFGTLPRDIRLRHVATRHYASGLVQSEYQVAAG
jgi:hypothetical protein